MTERPLTVAILTGEASGDLLGVRLMEAIRAFGVRPRFVGVGGEAMRAAGCASAFPAESMSHLGLAGVVRDLPRIWRRLDAATEAVIAADPDVLVLIDSSGFTHTVGKRVRRRRPGVPIVKYVAPSVWAYRPGRARAMRGYVDHVLALLPFEPEVMASLGGPPTTYVGHPLVEFADALRSRQGERTASDAPLIVVLPGSRQSEIDRLMPVFGGTVAAIAARRPDARFVLPTLPFLEGTIVAQARTWPMVPEIVTGAEARQAAFRKARAALAASGTVTLELALAEVPTVVAYRLEPLIRPFKGLLRAPSIVLANLVAGRNAMPEFLDAAARPDRLADAVVALIDDGPERAAQLQACRDIAERVRVEEAPSRQAARIVLGFCGRTADGLAAAERGSG